MITHVAIIYNGKLYSLPKPNRHHHIIHMIYKETGESVGFSWQGFLDDTGRFVGRKEGVKIAYMAGQIGVIRPKTSPRNMLFSEDVW